jgi:hypothetical protein
LKTAWAGNLFSLGGLLLKILSVAVSAALLASTALAAPATAAPAAPAASGDIHLSRMTMGYSYFNRPGATIAEHDIDVSACTAEASTTRSYDEVIGNYGGGGLLGVAIGSAFQNAYRNGTVGSALENCMVVRGWRVVSVSDTLGKSLAALTKADLAERLAPWIGADNPEGRVVRWWRNDIQDAATPRYEIRPDHTNDGSLSLKAATGLQLPDVGRNIPTFSPVKLDRKWPTKLVKPAEMDAVIPAAGVVIVRLDGLSFRNGIGFTFTRMGPDRNTLASTVDSRPDRLFFAVGLLFAKKGGNWVALPVPPGRWRISSLGASSVLNVCLGSPAFEVKAGDVIYAGGFNMGGSVFGPDMDLAPVKAYLGNTAAANRLKAADYVNGTTDRCGDTAIYALEFPGYPFEPGFRYGGALASAVPAPPTTNPASPALTAAPPAGAAPTAASGPL